MDQHKSVEKTETGKHEYEDCQMEPDQFEDASMPGQHHLPEALAGPLRVFVPVREDVSAAFPHFCYKIISIFFHFRYFRCFTL